MANFRQPLQAVGFSSGLINIAPDPISAQRDPSTTDEAFDGQIWVNTLSNNVWIAAGTSAGATQWVLSGSSTFSATDITINPGPSVFNGDFSVNSTTGAANTISMVSNGAVTETIRITNTQGTATNAIAITAQQGGLDLISASAGADSILVDASGVAGGVTLNSGTGGITFTTTGALTFNPGTATALVVAVGDLDLTATTGGVNITGGIAAINAIDLDASDVAGGIQITSGTGGFNQVTTGAIVLQSDLGASLTDAGGAGVDITVQSTAGSILLNAGEAASDALNFDAASGGMDVDVALQLNLASSQNSATAISLNASAGAIELQAQGAAGEDIVLNNVAGSINLTPGEAAANALRINCAAGGVDLDAALQVNIASSQNAADALRLVASAGGIDIDAVGAAGEDIDLTNTGGSINLVATEAAANALRFNASAGGIDVDSVLGVAVTDAGGAGVDIVVTSTAGSINLVAGEAAADAINVDSTGGFDLDAALQVNLDSAQAAATAVRIISSNAAGGIDIDSGTGGITVDSTGVLSLDAAGNTNLTTTGAFTMLVTSTGGATTVSSAKAADNAAVLISASAADGGVTLDAGVVPGVRFTNGTQTVQFLVGTGAPGGVVTALQGSIYLNVAGTGADTLYVNTDGGTTWSAR